jgi:soluble lytic murein transglycosylase-like protein
MRLFILTAALLMATPARADDLADLQAYISWFKRNMRPSKQQAAIMLAPDILEASKKHGLDPFLVVTTIRFESSFFPSRHGEKGEFGLMQVMRLSDLATVDEQLDRGAAYLAYCVEKCKTVEGAISYYMGGPCSPALKKARGRFRHYVWAKRRFSNAKN